MSVGAVPGKVGDAPRQQSRGISSLGGLRLGLDNN